MTSPLAAVGVSHGSARHGGPARADVRARSALRALGRRVPSAGGRRLRTILTLAVVTGTGMIAASAIIHLHLWLAGYRHIPRIGPLFLAQSVAGIVAAVVLLASRRVFALAAGALYLAATTLGLVISASVGFLGFHDSFNAAWAGWAVGVQATGIVVLVAVLLLDRLMGPPGRATTPDAPA